MRRFAHLSAVLATTVALLPAVSGSHPYGGAPPHSTGQGTVSAVGGPKAANPTDPEAETQALTVAGISPASVEPDSTIVISGEVTNTSENPVEELRVRFRYSATPFTTRSDMEAYAAGERAEPRDFGPEERIEQPLAPGESLDYTLSIEAEQLPLSELGVYPMAVDVVDGDWSRVGLHRSFLPFFDPEEEVEPTGIAWLWPLMDRPYRADDDTFLGDGLESRFAPEGRLGRLLEIGAEAAGAGTRDEDDDTGEIPLTWAIDPALLDDADRLSTEHQVIPNPTAVPARAAPGVEAAEPSETAQEWLEQVRETLAEEHVVATPYAAPDLVALLDADLAGDAEAAVRLGRETVARLLEREADTGVAWPPHGAMDDAVLEFLAERGADTFLLNETELPSLPDVGHTPTAETALPAEALDDDGTALVIDAQLRQTLAEEGGTATDGVLTRQRFAAETLMLTAEQPLSGRTVVAAPPVDWDPEPELARAVLEHTGELPWLDPVALEDLQAEPDAEALRSPFGEGEPIAAPVLSGTYLDQVKGIRRDAQLLSSILTDQEDPFRPAILRLEAAAWEGREELAGQARAQVSTALQETLGEVRILPGEAVTMASKSGQAPIIVANDLEHHSVTVHLAVFSENSERLAVGDYQESMEIAPGSRTTVFIPLTATVNDRTELRASLHNADGEPITSEELVIPVTVTHLGTSALAIAGVAALLFVLLLAPRLLRRLRRRSGPPRNEEEHSASPEDAGTDDGAAETAASSDPEPPLEPAEESGTMTDNGGSGGKRATSGDNPGAFPP